MSTQSQSAFLQKNQDAYGDAFGDKWRLTVFEPLHEGWAFCSVGGLAAIRRAAALAQLTTRARVLSLCSGLGDECCFLAQGWGCEVVGVELNESQVEHARARLSARPERRLVRYIQGDVARDLPAGPFDVVVALECLLHVEGRAHVLREVERRMASDGLFYITDLVAGPAIRKQDREFMWDEDGIASLWDFSELEEELHGAGFELIESECSYLKPERAFRTIVQESDRHRAILTEEYGVSGFERWRRNADRYTELFGERRLGYVEMAVRRGAGAASEWKSQLTRSS